MSGVREGAISWNFSKVKKEGKRLGFKILSTEYKNNSEKLEWKHIPCGHEFFATWANIYNNKQGCARCSQHILPTQDDCIKLIRDSGYLLMDDKVYSSSKTKMKLMHINESCDNHIFYVTWSNFSKSNGTRCPKCFGKNRLTIEFCRDFSKSLGYDVLSEEYFNLKTKLKFLHVSCKSIFEMTWGNFFHNEQRCPTCQRDKRRYTYKKNKIIKNGSVKDVFPELAKEWSSKNEKSPSEFSIGSPERIWWKCDKHGDFLTPIFYRTYKKTGCPSCNSSKGEISISNYLNKVIGIENYFREYKIKNAIVSKMKFDFFIPSLKLIIEYDGIAHFKPIRFGGVSEEEAKENLKSQKKRDRIKNKFCKKENYNLLRISYLEFSDIESILEKTLKNLLNYE